MKSFACGDVVPGCEAQWTAADDEQLLAFVAAHAAEAHGLTEVSPELANRVQAAINSVD